MTFEQAMGDVRALDLADIGLAAELDLGEAGDILFRQDGRDLVTYQRSWARPSDIGDEMVEYLERWRGIVRAGGTALGAFSGGRLVGIAVLRLDLEPGVAQLDGLYVDRAHRRAGVAETLSRRLEAVARQADASSMYVSATPTPSAVGFYRSLGYEPTDSPNPRLLALEPDDIHLRKAL